MLLHSRHSDFDLPSAHPAILHAQLHLFSHQFMEYWMQVLPLEHQHVLEHVIIGGIGNVLLHNCGPINATPQNVCESLCVYLGSLAFTSESSDSQVEGVQDSVMLPTC